MTTTTGPLARETPHGFEVVLDRLPGLLQHEGFGILTEIDLQKTFATKLGVPFRRYKILGACNPGFARRAVSAHPEVGVMLPCNLAVYELEDGTTRVVAVDPLAQLALGEHDLADLASEVRHRLEKVLAGL
jgi:uncharacterized protein (DUF302 family)